MGILNEIYYNSLIDKYSISLDCERVLHLTVKLILNNYDKRNLHFNFPKGYNLQGIINLLYENLSKQIFKNHADITDYSVGSRLKKNNEKGRKIYVISEIKGNDYILAVENNDLHNTRIIIKSFDRLKRCYTEVQKNTRNTTLQKFHDYFKDVNPYNFTPQYFSKKLVFIAGQNVWNNLKNKNCIPTTYLPNTREEEQTIRKSIDALKDCIAFVTPKYGVCYEEILKRNIAVDSIIICDTDLSSISQIIQDQSKYNFNLIILSDENEVQRIKSIYLWNWQKEEVNMIEEKASKSVKISQINDYKLNDLVQHFEECMQYVSSLEMPIRLKGYGYFLRLALNALQEEQLEYLLMRLKGNNELERNEGGYEDFGDNNPKEALKNLISHLKENNPKLKKLNKVISNTTKKTLCITDREDIEILKTNGNCQFITQKELKKQIKNGKTDNKAVVFYTFNGLKDFNFICHLQNNVELVLYQQEIDLYYKQLQIHTKQLETELTSEDRYIICDVKYKPIVKREVKVCPTLEQIIERLEQRSNTAYDGYKDESDSLLDDLEEEITYQMTMSNDHVWTMQSNETVFDSKGNLIKSYRLKNGNNIRIYPKEQLAENLFQIAVDVEPEKFGLIDKHSNLWKNALNESLLRSLSMENLYEKLKTNGLKVLQGTVEAYFRSGQKFPMYNSDLRAILKIAGKELLYEQIKKSKRLYNSTMIALGRGIKQELQQFLKEKTVGEILQKKSFTKETLQKFIDEYMPLLTITKIEEVVSCEQQ